MKLVLAINQSDRFRAFYQTLRQKSGQAFDYASYRNLLFQFAVNGAPIAVIDTASGKPLTVYDGVYINGYLRAYELAAAVATCCDYLHIPFIDSEMRDAPSLSKLTAYAKLAAAGVSIPPTFAGTKQALLAGNGYYSAGLFPAVLKRADADQGIDNFKVSNMAQAGNILQPYDDKSLWILQQYIPNNGFYRLTYYNQRLKFCIFRSLDEHRGGDALKAHMFKPKGGQNARLIPLADVPLALTDVCKQALTVMKRQIGSVDCLYDQVTQQVHVLEVNYNPQLATIETLSEVRQQAFIESMQANW